MITVEHLLSDLAEISIVRRHLLRLGIEMVILLPPLSRAQEREEEKPRQVQFLPSYRGSSRFLFYFSNYYSLQSSHHTSSLSLPRTLARDAILDESSVFF